MKVFIKKPIRVNIISGEVEVTEQELRRLVLLDACEFIEERETPEKKTTRKAKK